MQAASRMRSSRPMAGTCPRSGMVALRPLSTKRAVALRATEGGAAPAAADGPALFELTKDNYWDYLKADEQKGMVIVVDCFTDWCGPCKMIYPDLVKLSAELEPKARIVKFNCNKANKELGVTLKIKVAPTFLVYQDGEKIGEMTGAKLEKLRNLINEKIGAPVPANALVA